MSDRRSFLSRLFAGTLATVALSLMYAVARFLRPPSTAPATLQLSSAALPSTVDSPGIFKLGSNDVAIVRTRDGDMIAMSLACTHTGCGVAWRRERNVFHCPCHNGVFAADGSVISGPPKRRLDRLRIESDGKTLRIIDEPI